MRVPLPSRGSLLSSQRVYNQEFSLKVVWRELMTLSGHDRSCNFSWTTCNECEGFCNLNKIISSIPLSNLPSRHYHCILQKSRPARVSARPHPPRLLRSSVLILDPPRLPNVADRYPPVSHFFKNFPGP